MRFITTIITALFLTACVSTNSSSVTGGTHRVVTKEDLPEAIRLNYETGVGYVRTGEFDAAEEKLMVVAQAAPNFADVYLQLGMAKQHQGKKSDAIALYSKAISVNPDFVEAYRMYAFIQCDSNDKDAPNKLARIGDNATTKIKSGIYGGAAACALAHNNPTLANDLADRAILNNPQYAESYYFKATALFGLKRYNEIFPILDRYHDLHGYQFNSVGLGLETANRTKNKVELAKYQNLMNRYRND